jgi:serine/threonine protein kinase
MISAESDRVRQYELLRLLGHGGFCAVYEARDRNSGELVALKRLKRIGAPALAAFKREFRMVQGVHHPNLVELRELFEADGACYIAMELVEGCDLVTYVRADHDSFGFNPSKLKGSFGQLIAGLQALHGAGLVHRDVKPRNVLVTAEGRVVLLDFGLATTQGDAAESGEIGLGTALYMAPEQARGAPPGAAADFYALGVCLYEALTGDTPFTAPSPFEVMEMKQLQAPPPPSASEPKVPPELDHLCLRLLDREPTARPSGLEAARQLGAPTLTSGQPEPPSAETFAGRAREIATLEREFARSRHGELALVLVEGESGIGKSALISEFLRGLHTSNPSVLVLRSRCYQNELLAYEAFDDAMEQLARMLATLSSAESAALVPARAVLLPRLFRAFEAVRALTEASTRDVPADPAAQRLAGFQALAQLLGMVARLRPVVLAIEDLHWADAESLRLLRAIVEDSEPPAILVVASLRPIDGLPPEPLAALTQLQGFACTKTLVLRGLAPSDARQLAARLIGGRGSDPQVDALVAESGGHPMLLAELANYVNTHAPPADHNVALNDALRARIGALPGDAHRLLCLVALAGRPCPMPVLAQALALDRASLQALAATLLAQKLLRRGHGHALGCYHDRIREVAEAELTPARARTLHASLAAALAQQPLPDPAELATHYDAAGEAAPALEAYARAGAQALRALAFSQAERCFKRALALAAEAGCEPGARTRLKLGLADALARGGRSAEAARHYFEAASESSGEDNTRLRIQAAQHLLQSAHVAEGMQAARALLSELGLSLPTSSAGTIARLLWDRAYLGLRGLQVSPAAQPPTLRERMQLDALWGLALPISWLDPLASATLSTRHLRLARALGAPAHMARALAEGAFMRVVERADDPEADVLLRRARELCDGADPALELSVAFREATSATFRWELPRAKERLEHALRIGTERCPDQPWLLTNVRTNLCTVLVNVGEHAQLSAASTAWLSEARDRNDMFARSTLTGLGLGIFRHLMQDQAELALDELSAAVAPWPTEPFSFVRMGEFIGWMYGELYRGGDGAKRWLERERARLSRALILNAGLGKATHLLYLSLASLAAYAADSGERAAHDLRETRAYVAKLKQVKSTLASLNALSFEAQLAALDGDVEHALQAARLGQTRCAASGYVFLSRSLQYLEGHLEGGDQGQQKRDDALHFYRAQGWQKPRRCLALLCPALDKLERT